MVRHLFSVLLLVLTLPSALAEDNLRIDTRALERLVGARQVVLIDARPVAAYQKTHLPGARNLPFTSTFEDFAQNGRVIPLSKAQTLFSDAGINHDDLVVIYDAGNMLHAARVMWTLHIYGHDKVRLLDGGLKAWQQAGLPLNDERVAFARSSFVPAINPKRLATRLSTLAASRTPDAYVILDAREKPHYEGRESEASRYGHIPQAIGIPSSDNLSTDKSRLKSREELAKLYSHLPRDKKIIIYCNVGIASSLEYLVMRDLGYDVANYDASWKEWGNDPSLPIREVAAQ